MPKNTYETYKDVKGEWRWRFFGANGKQISKSSEGYKNKADCNRAIEIMQTSAKAAIKLAPKPKKKRKKK